VIHSQTWPPERSAAIPGEATASLARRVVSAHELADIWRFLQHKDGAAVPGTSRTDFCS